jgi:phenylalanyl-tRNA synthetase alpha chain
MDDRTTKTLAELGATAPEDVARLFAELRAAFDAEATAASGAEALEALRIAWVGRKSGRLKRVTENWLKPAAAAVRPAVGQQLNALRHHVEEKLNEKKAAGPKHHVLAADPGSYGITGAPVGLEVHRREMLDLSLPGAARPIGARHVLRQTQEEICRIFARLGFTVVEGPEIETPYYNFEALNIPEHHPARDTMDTFYLAAPEGAPELLLRTHTSPMQIHWMEQHQPPVRIVVPGRVYRRDNPDATHSFAFHQVEGLAVDEDITFCDFKGVVEHFVHAFLGPRVKTRLRPSYFQFTEPSAEVDGTCVFCDGRGCRICKQTGWIELFGAGMVNPAVYRFVNYDARKLGGFAFGIGIERMAMLRYDISDIQLFYQNDARFLAQFR